MSVFAWVGPWDASSLKQGAQEITTPQNGKCAFLPTPLLQFPQKLWLFTSAVPVLCPWLLLLQLGSFYSYTRHPHPQKTPTPTNPVSWYFQVINKSFYSCLTRAVPGCLYFASLAHICGKVCLTYFVLSLQLKFMLKYFESTNHCFSVW